MKTIFSNGWSGPKRPGWSGNVSLVLAALLLASCSQKQASETATEGKTGEKIIIRGSNTFGEELAPQLIADYKKDHSSVAFDLETKGTSYGMGALMGGYCDIAGASRLPSKEELELAKSAGVKPVTIGGVEASFAAVKKGEYPYARTLHLYTGKGRETPATLAFIQFIQSSRGQSVLTNAGFVPLP